MTDAEALLEVQKSVGTTGTPAEAAIATLLAAIAMNLTDIAKSLRTMAQRDTPQGSE